MYTICIILLSVVLISGSSWIRKMASSPVKPATPDETKESSSHSPSGIGTEDSKCILQGEDSGSDGNEVEDNNKLAMEVSSFYYSLIFL